MYAFLISLCVLGTRKCLAYMIFVDVTMRDLRLSQRSWRRFISSGILHPCRLVNIYLTVWQFAQRNIPEELDLYPIFFLRSVKFIQLL